MEFISDILEPGEKPKIGQIIDEIEMVFVQPVRTAYDILASDEINDGSAENLLYVTLGHWKKFSKELLECSRKDAS
jgi:hypothetical protein